MAPCVRTIAICAVAATLLPSCASVTLFQQDEVDYFEDLGTVHITLFDPVPFEQYKDDLQPTFSLSEAEALKEVIPVTQFQDQSRFAGSRVGIAVVGPTTTDKKTETEQRTITSESTSAQTTIQTTKGRESAAPPDVQGADVSARKTTAQTSSITPKSPGEQAPIDPFLKYWTAAALYQEVHLLNRFWKSLAQSEEFVPYIVRTQIATLPHLRNAPYDVVVDLGFWTRAKEGAIRGTTAPKVIPLIVTDNLEAQSRRLSAEQVREVALALKGMAGLTGIGASISDYDQLLRSVIGRDINSLLTVARLDDSVLRVRLGALQQAGSAYAMVPRTHTITTLLLVPKSQDGSGRLIGDQHILNVESYARFFDARTGKPLKSITEEEPGKRYGARVNKILTRAGVAPLNDEQVKALIAANESQHLEQFIRALFPAKEQELKDFFACAARLQKSLGLSDEVKRQQAVFDKVSEIRSRIGRGDQPLGGVFEPKTVSPVQVGDIPTCPEPDTVANWGGYEAFVSSIRALKPKISGVTGDSPYDRASADFPPARAANSVCVFGGTAGCPDKASEPVTLLDNGTALTVAILGLGKPVSSRVDAVLHVVEKDGEKRVVAFPADSIKTDAKGSGLHMEFPSLIPWRLHGKNVDRKLVMHWIDEQGLQSSSVEFVNTKYQAVPSAVPIEARMEKAQGSEHIAQKDAKGELWLTFSGIEKNKTKIYLSIANARFAKATPDGAIAGDKRRITKDGDVKLELENLAAGTAVVLKLRTDDKRESGPLEVPVK